MTRIVRFAGLCLLALLSGCRCDDNVNRVKPEISVRPTSLDFQKVKVGGSAELTLTIDAVSKAALTVTDVVIEGGGAPAYEVIEKPASVAQLSNAPLTVRFKPTALNAYPTTLVILSNDEARGRLEVPISGEGAKPVIQVTPECTTTNKCTAMVKVTPPEIVFADEPFARQL